MAESGESPKPDKAEVSRRSFLHKAAIYTSGALAAAFLPSKPRPGGAEISATHAQESAAGDTPPQDSPLNKNEIIEEIMNKNDLIPREELWEKYKIKILDSPDVTFDFRKTAIGREHLFKSQEKRSGAVKIVLVNGHYIHPDFLTEEQKKELTLDELSALTRDVEKAKSMVRSHFTSEKSVKPKSEEYQNKLTELNASLISGQITQDKFNVMQQVYDDEYRPYIKGPNDADLLEDLTGMAPPINDRNPNDPEATRLIFLPVKDPPVKIFKSGEEIVRVEPDPYFLRAPQPEKSFTDPDDLDVNFKGELYPIQKPTSITVARHEIKHAAGMGHPAADLEPYNDLVVAKREARKGNFDGYWAVWKDKKNGVMIGKTDTGLKAA